MNRVPNVSIVLPVRNAAGTLVAALERIRAQTLAAWELVAVDDGSTDETARILNTAARADARIRVVALRRFVESPVAHPSVMFRRDLLAQHGGYAAGDFAEDYELWLRWMDAGVRFGKVNAELLVWNDPPARWPAGGRSGRTTGRGARVYPGGGGEAWRARMDRPQVTPPGPGGGRGLPARHVKRSRSQKQA